MLATLIIVFREMIEAGLVVGIVLAATRGVEKRERMVGIGILGGVIGACILAAFAGEIADMMEGNGQELFNASVMGIAVLMLTWHNVWMAREGRHIAQEMRMLGENVAKGHRTLVALAVVVGIAVLREGSEVVLFLYGILLSGGNSAMSMIIGGVLGVALGAGISIMMYFGLLRIPTHRLFAVTSGLITLLACGMAAQAVTFLQQAGWVNILPQTMWDTSAILPNGSILGKTMHTLVGYTERPSALQLVVYLSTFAGIMTLMRMFGRVPLSTQHSKKPT